MLPVLLVVHVHFVVVVSRSDLDNQRGTSICLMPRVRFGFSWVLRKEIAPSLWRSSEDWDHLHRGCIENTQFTVGSGFLPAVFPFLVLMILTLWFLDTMGIVMTDSTVGQGLRDRQVNVFYLCIKLINLALHLIGCKMSEAWCSQYPVHLTCSNQRLDTQWWFGLFSFL